MTGRVAFLIVAGSVLVLVLFMAVARPAVERGGWGELGIVAVSVLAILLVERWLRSR